MLPPDDPISSPLDRIRAYLRTDMKTLRWVFLALYIALILGLSAFLIGSGGSDGFVLFWIFLGAMLPSQALLILGAGTIDLCKPVVKRRLLMPAIAASFMATVLLTGLFLALTELLVPHPPDSWIILFWTVVLTSWSAWGYIIYHYARTRPRYTVVGRLATALFAGSLAELLAAVPSHLIVIRRPGCLVGLGTMLGIVAGILVMLFSFGPMIALLFLRPRYRREKMRSTHLCQSCGYDLRASTARCPECGTPFTAPQSPLSLDPHATLP